MARDKEVELKLLGLSVSPYVIRARMALGLKGLSYEYVEEDLFNKSDLLLASNPVHQKVPVLIHAGRPVCESFVVVQYIDEAFAGAGQAILPADPYDRAVARFWAAFTDDKFFPAWIGIVKAKTKEERAEQLKETLATLKLIEEAFKKCSKGKTFFAGDSIGCLDITLGCSLGCIKAIQKMANVELFDASKTPHLAAWTKHFCATNIAKDLIPEVDKIVAYNKILSDKFGFLPLSNEGST